MSLIHIRELKRSEVANWREINLARFLELLHKGEQYTASHHEGPMLIKPLQTDKNRELEIRDDMLSGKFII